MRFLLALLLGLLLCQPHPLAAAVPHGKLHPCCAKDPAKPCDGCGSPRSDTSCCATTFAFPLGLSTPPTIFLGRPLGHRLISSDVFVTPRDERPPSPPPRP